MSFGNAKNLTTYNGTFTFDGSELFIWLEKQTHDPHVPSALQEDIVIRATRSGMIKVRFATNSDRSQFNPGAALVLNSNTFSTSVNSTFTKRLTPGFDGWSGLVSTVVPMAERLFRADYSDAALTLANDAGGTVSIESSTTLPNAGSTPAAGNGSAKKPKKPAPKRAGGNVAIWIAPA